MMTLASRSLASSSRAVRLVSWLNSSTFSAWRSTTGGQATAFDNTWQWWTTGDRAGRRVTAHITHHRTHIISSEPTQYHPQSTPRPPDPITQPLPCFLSPSLPGNRGRGQKMEGKSVQNLLNWKITQTGSFAKAKKLCVVWWHMQTEALSRLQPTNQGRAC